MVKETCEVFISKVGTLNSLTVVEESSLSMSTFEINGHVGRKPCSYRLNKLPEIRRKMLKWARPRIIERHFPADTDDALLTVFEAAMLQAVGFNPGEAATAVPRINQITAGYREEKRRLYRRKFNQAERVYLDLEMTLADLHSYELPPAKVSNAQDYRALFFRAQVEAGVNERSQREIAATVGVSRQYVPTLQKRAGVEGEEQFKIIEFSSENIHAIEKTGYEVQGFPRSIIIDDKKSVPYKRDEVEAVVNEAVRAGQVVKVRYQIASKQVIVRDDPLPVVPPVPAVTPKAEAPKQKQLSFDDLQQPVVPEEVEQLPDEIEQPPIEDEAEQPETREKVIRIKPGKYFGPEYDRAWVYHQLAIALKVSGSCYRLRGIVLIDSSTGEIVRQNVNERDLVAAIVGEALEVETPAYDESLLEAYLDVVAQ